MQNLTDDMCVVSKHIAAPLAHFYVDSKLLGINSVANN